MSAIETVNPAGAEAISLGGERMREFRTWLLDAWIAFTARHHAGGTANDPATSGGGFAFPTTAPSMLSVGGMFITSGGAVRYYVTGPVLQLGGDIEIGTKVPFNQAAAPLGWTRDTSLAQGSTLRYVTGVPTTGGSVDVLDLTHTLGGLVDLNFADAGGANQFATAIATHDLAYVDVLLATR